MATNAFDSRLCKALKLIPVSGAAPTCPGHVALPVSPMIVVLSPFLWRKRADRSSRSIVAIMAHDLRYLRYLLSVC